MQGTFEWLGFDFMVDSTHTVWLLEVEDPCLEWIESVAWCRVLSCVQLYDGIYWCARHVVF